MKNHKAIILAGGKATRLYPITYEIPKPLLPVKKKPIINYLVDLFCSQGIKDITVLINKDFREEFDWWQKRIHLLLFSVLRCILFINVKNQMKEDKSRTFFEEKVRGKGYFYRLLYFIIEG